MSQYDWDSHEHDALYEIPIETLGLSDKAIRAAKRTGMETEVKPKLEAHGYWPLDDKGAS